MEIADPTATRTVFDRQVQSVTGGPYQIPGVPGFRWKVSRVRYPTLVAQVKGGPGVLFQVLVDCTNYDYDPPAVRYLRDNGDPISWRVMSGLGRFYLHTDSARRGLFQDIVSLSDAEGFVCVGGHRGYHEAHPAENWFDSRLTLGRLFSIIETSILAVDFTKAKRSL